MNRAFIHREELEKDHYVQQASSNKYWFNFYAGKLENYKSKNERLCLIIFGDKHLEDDFFSIPFAYMAHLFRSDNMNRKRGSARWVGNIVAGDYLRIPPYEVPIHQFRGLLPGEIPEHYFAPRPADL